MPIRFQPKRAETHYRLGYDSEGQLRLYSQWEPCALSGHGRRKHLRFKRERCGRHLRTRRATGRYH